MSVDLRMTEDFVLHLFAPLTDINVIRFGHERIVISGLVGVQIVPKDGKFILSSSCEGVEPEVIEDEFDAVRGAFTLYCILLRDAMTDDYLAQFDDPPPETQTEKKT